jgi:hypothetical protein
MHRLTKKHYSILSVLALVVLVMPNVALAWSPIQETLYFLVVNLFGMLVRIGGAILDYAIDNFVLGFGATFAHSGIGVAVNNGWVVIRDSINLFFIFGLVYIGIKMILDSSNSNARRWLANLILAALLINFSLFVTKMVIDFSNQISAEIAVAGLGAQPTGDGTYKSEISANMMGQLGLSNAFQTTSKPDNAGYGYIFGLAILFMITAFVFGAGGILLITRFAILNLYLVFSAAMFLSWVLPGLSDTMDKYWKGFIKRAFFAPIFFLFLYFAFQMVGELQKTVAGGLATGQSIAGGLGGDAAANSAVDIQNATLGTMPFFFLVCIFMIIALIAANKLGDDLGNKAVASAKRGYTKALKWTGSQTAGRGARLASERAANTASGRLQNMENSNNRFVRGLARSNAVQGVSNKAINVGRNAKFGLSRTREQDRAMRNQTDTAADTRGNLNTHLTNATAGGDTPAEIAARQDARNAAAQTAGRMTPQQIQDLVRANPALLNNPVFLASLNDGHVSGLAASGIRTNAQMGELRESRDQETLTAFNDTLASTTASSENLNAALDGLTRNIQGLSQDRTNSALNRYFTNDAQGNPAPIPPHAMNMLAHMTNEQFNGWANSGQSSREQVERARAARSNTVAAAVTNRNLAGSWETDPNAPAGAPPVFTANASMSARSIDRRRALFRNAQQAGGLPVAVLADPNVSEFLTPQIVDAFISNNPGGPDRDRLRQAIEVHVNANGAGTNRDAWTRWNNTPNGAQIGAFSFNQPNTAAPVPAPQPTPGYAATPGGILLPNSPGNGPRPRP